MSRFVVRVSRAALVARLHSALLGVTLIAGSLRSAQAQPVVLISQQRGVSASVYAPACTPPGDVHYQQAPDFADFDAGAQASRSCGLTSVGATADQRSVMGQGGSIQAQGAAAAQANDAAAPQAHSASVFRVAVRLDAGAQLTMRGQLNCHADPGVAAAAFVRLLDHAGATILLLQAQPQNWPTGLDIDDVHDLPPGAYALEVQAAADIAAPPNLNGSGAFDITAVFETRRCTADFDGDGSPGTDADIEAFFACLGGSCCPTCVGADFNADGDAGTDADIESFFRVLGGASC